LADLQIQNALLREEINQFRDANDWERRIPWESKLVRVVGRDPFNWWRRIKINLGSNKGIRFNQPVISSKGNLVGRVSEVGPLTSWVVLAGDPNCRFSALIKESRSQGGIVSPRQYSSDPRVVELTYLPNDVELRPGQAVVTSGLGGGFPKEIPVGLVVDSWISKDGLYTEARVKLHANLNQLETVRVLTHF
jgi:rod shape-determining protein MreC